MLDQQQQKKTSIQNIFNICFTTIYLRFLFLSHDHLTTWPPDHLTTWLPDHLTTWPPDHLTTWPPISLPVTLSVRPHDLSLSAICSQTFSMTHTRNLKVKLFMYTYLNKTNKNKDYTLPFVSWKRFLQLPV